MSCNTDKAMNTTPFCSQSVLLAHLACNIFAGEEIRSFTTVEAFTQFFYADHNDGNKSPFIWYQNETYPCVSCCAAGSCDLPALL
eukprot:m.37261 g.37261  ORF g.37261 m.37261 type:complete len:85 (+) comp11366_c0_seq3:81-335(+)